MIVEIPVMFPGGAGSMLSGRLVRGNSDLARREIGVLVTGSWLTVKEQMPLFYARRLAALGYTAFIFDFSGFGESGGEPRQAEIPMRKIADIRAAAEFLSTLSLVHLDRICLVAICASAQYGLHAIAQGAPIAAFASVAGWFHDASSIAGFYGNREGVGRRLEFAREDIAAFLQGKDRKPAPAYAPGDERAGMHFELGYYADPTRGAVSTWKNEMAPMSWTHWLTFDGLSVAGSNGVPSLMIHGPGCALPENARSVYDAWPGEKRLEWLEGAQTDFYDRPDRVEPAIAAIDEWFKSQRANGRAPSIDASPRYLS
jgi:fermentation-respiration switch protein FrsA (DUF1100 family)